MKVRIGRLRMDGLITAACLVMLANSGRAQVATLAAQELAPMPGARMTNWQVLLPSGKIASIGGHGPGFVALNTADIYDPVENTWESRTMTSVHDGFALAKLPNGKYLVAGSAFDLGIPGSAGVDIFDPDALTFTAATPMNRGRMFSSGTTLKGETSMLFRNWNLAAVGNGPTAPTTFVVATSTVVAYANTYHWNFGEGTGAPGTISLRESGGTVYGPWQATGAPGQGGVINAVWEVRPNVTIPPGTYEVLDSDTATWSQNSGSEGRGFAEIHQSTSPAQGKVLVVGGWYNNDAGSVSELYDPVANNWSDTGPMVTPRSLPVVVALDDGRALVSGGFPVYGGDGVEGVEAYDPATNTFSEVRSSLFPDETGWAISCESRRTFQDDQTLADGRLLLVAYRGAEAQLFTVNPADGAVAKWGPQPYPPGPVAIAWAVQQPVIDRTRGFAISMGYDTTQPRAAMVCQTLPLDGSDFSQVSNIAATGAWPSYASRTLLPDGTLIQTGGHLTNNFDAVANAYRYTIGLVNPPPQPDLEPVLHIRIANSNEETHNYRYLWTGPEGEGPVTHGPTADLDDTLSQDPPNITFDPGDTWTVTVTPIGAGGIEGRPRVAAFRINALGQAIFDGWVIN